MHFSGTLTPKCATSCKRQRNASYLKSSITAQALSGTLARLPIFQGHTCPSTQCSCTGATSRGLEERDDHSSSVTTCCLVRHSQKQCWPFSLPYHAASTYLSAVVRHPVRLSTWCWAFVICCVSCPAAAAPIFPGNRGQSRDSVAAHFIFSKISSS